jgi:cell division protein FtsI (penicillin-binding protein 3)
MAAMEVGGINPKDEIDTGNGIISFHGHRMSDSNADEGGNGVINLEDVFALSSNVGTAMTIKKAFNDNPQDFLNALSNFGVSQTTGIQLMGEAEPQVYKTVGEGRWSKISLTQMAIGYELTQTPLQTLSLFNAVANNGTMVRPILVEQTEHNGQPISSFGTEVLQKNICSSATLETCQRMLRSVADPDGQGTAQYIFAKTPYRVAGKTGTARIAGPNGYDGRYRASFAGYFPAEAPRYSCIVVIADTRSGAYYGSTIACPVFRDVANKVYATDPTFHHTTMGPLAQSLHLPGSKDGAKMDLITLYAALGLPFIEEGESDWVTVTTSSEIAALSERTLEPHGVPDVRGMGLRDALYLLENAGLIVKSEGSGTVRRQSIRPGTELRSRQTINLELS